MTEERTDLAPIRRSAVLVMGTAGSGKTSVCDALAAYLGPQAQTVDGDAYHPPANIERMRAGIPLTDADRDAWLQALAKEIQRWWLQGDSFILLVGCSALKRRYRDRLRVLPPGVLTFVYLRGSRELLAARLKHRDAQGGHFMAASMLASQLAILEEPDPRHEADAICIDLADGQEKSLARLVAEIVDHHPGLRAAAAPLP